MSLPKDLRKAIEGGRVPQVEDAWLEHMEEQADDLEFFVAVARSLVGSGESEQATLLLELLDEHLRSHGRWQLRLRLLEEAGEILMPPDRLHSQILESLRRLYEDSPSLEGLIDKVGLLRGTGDLAKSWEKVARLHGLMQFELGAAVRMEGKGVGRIDEVNLDLESFKVRFDDGRELRVGFAAAPKLLEPLASGHFLRRRLEEPETLRRLKTEQPPELLRLVLQSFGSALTAAQIREATQGIVDANEWAGWWSTARSHPQVVPGSGGRQTYAWADSSGEAVAEIRQVFQRARWEERIKLLNRHGGRDEELGRWMSHELAEAGRRAADTRPEEALAIWTALERAGSTPPDRAWSPEQLVDRSTDLVRTVSAIGDRALRETVLELVRKRRDDWTAVFRGVLERETDARLLASLAGQLEREAPAEAKQFFDEVLSAPRRRPAAFVWLLEQGAEARGLAGRNPLPLLRLVIAADGDRAFLPHRARLRRLWAEGAHIHLLDRLEPHQAEAAYQLVERAPMEEYLRTPYLNALQLRFPELGSGGGEHLYATAAAIETRRAELKELLEEQIPANRRAIQAARELGDLRENFEYKSARQRHEFLSARAAALDRDLSRVRKIDPGQIDGGEIRIGSSAILETEAGERRTVTILGPWESRPEEDVFSYDSEIAAGLLGKGRGDTVRVGDSEYRVVEIARAAT